MRAGNRGRNRPGKLILGHYPFKARTSKPVSLHQLDAEIGKAARLVSGFYPLGDHVNCQGCTHGHHTGNDGAP